MSVTVPLVLFKMATASSCVTPSRLCPLTAMIWSPLFRRPSSAAAPWEQNPLEACPAALTAELTALSSAHLPEHGLDVDGQVSVGAAVAADDAEAQPVRAPPEGDALVLGGAGNTHS